METVTMSLKDYDNFDDMDIPFGSFTLLTGQPCVNLRLVTEALAFHTEARGVSCDKSFFYDVIPKDREKAVVTVGGCETDVVRGLFGGEKLVSPGGPSEESPFMSVRVGGVIGTLFHGEPSFGLYLDTCRGEDCLYICRHPETMLFDMSSFFTDRSVPPSCQGRIVESLARLVRRGVRVVATTHSEHIFMAVRLAVRNKLMPASKTLVHYFYKDDDGKIRFVSPAILKDGCVDIWPDGFFDQITKDLVKLC